jgi:hypothetical protein
MPAQKPKLAASAAAQYKFATWDEMAAEATVDIPPYELPMSDKPGDVIIIPMPDGDRYLNIDQGQRVGNVNLLLENLIPDAKDRARVRTKMRGTSFLIVDVLTSNVLNHYFGLTKPTGKTEADPGNSAAS